MNKFKCVILTFLSISIVHHANAGERAGNGGAVGVCFDSPSIVHDITVNQNNQISDDQLNHVTSIKALDLYEAESRFSTANPDSMLGLPNANESKEDFLTRIAVRFANTIPALRDELISRSVELSQADVRYYTAGGLDRIYDTSEAYYLDPLKCVIATAIRQSVTNGILKLEYDNRLFEHPLHNNQSKGILYLHETIYRWAIGRGATDSQSTRDITSLILLKQLGRAQTLTHLMVGGFILTAFCMNGTPYAIGETFPDSFPKPTCISLGGRGYAFQDYPDNLPIYLLNGVTPDLSLAHDWTQEVLIPAP